MNRAVIVCHRWLFVAAGIASIGGCSAIPEVRHSPQIHNPFPQLHRIAVMPFNNLSNEPTINGREVANHYFTELQQIPGFEVIPVGVVEQRMRDLGFPQQLATAAEYRQLADSLDADAIVIGAITEFQIYRPSRMGLAVRWYAANPGFHPIPPGYGIPWGTVQEEYVPDQLIFEAEYALAREQLKTQTPVPQMSAEKAARMQAASHSQNPESGTGPLPVPQGHNLPAPEFPSGVQTADAPAELPEDWPDPRGFVPPAPSPTRPTYRPQFDPVMSLARLYDSKDANFTERLADYFYFRDDPRFGGWQSYLSVTDDFIQFCCHLHITEMLSSRGGAGKTQVVWRWPIDR